MCSLIRERWVSMGKLLVRAYLSEQNVLIEVLEWHGGQRL